MIIACDRLICHYMKSKCYTFKCGFATSQNLAYEFHKVEENYMEHFFFFYFFMPFSRNIKYILNLVNPFPNDKF